jgi:hypothetical protein
MKKTWLVAVVIASLLFQTGIASALTSSEGKQAWLSAMQTRISADAAYKQAQLNWASDKTPENGQKVIDVAKTVLNAVLDEAKAWLEWKNQEARESDAPQELKTNISNDVKKNLAKIETLREEVARIKTRVDVAGVFLKMVGSYVELLADVARNTGAIWVNIGNKIADRTADYEIKLRTTANGLVDNTAILEKLDIAKSEIDLARTQINAAETAYKKVIIPGTPLVKFSEGNSYLRQAKVNLQAAVEQLHTAFNLIISSK